MSEPRLIKRYANRKLYDTFDSCYITLDQIGALVRDGEEIRIIDNTTKDDLTSVTLAQIIFEEEKRKKHFLPLSTLKSILQSRGEQIQEIARSLKEGAGKIIRIPKENGEEISDQSPEELEKKISQEDKNFLQNLMDGPHRVIEELQRRVDERVKSALYSLTIPLNALQRELSELSIRLEALEKRLTEVSKETNSSSTEENKTDED